MNELQIKLTADISVLQSALKQAKKALKDFSETSADPKANKPLERQIGLIQELTIKAKALRTALENATNEKDIASYNSQLEGTSRELSRLNALGRSVTANLSGVGGGFNKVATQGGNATGVALEFNRVIQDAPFGLIGIGNNLQQLAGNFSTLKAQAGSTGKAVGLALTSIISPVNLALLAVSALTAAFTAYQMGAFDFLKSNEEAAKSVKELADEIDNAISRTSAESANISALRTTIEDETVSRDKRLAAVERLQSKYPEIFGNANKEKLLNGELIGSYELLTKAIIQRAEASLAEERIPDINKEKQAVDSLIKVKQKQLETETALSKSLSTFVPQGQIFSQADIAKAKANDLKKEIDELSTKSRGLQINIDGFTESIVSYQQEFIDLLEPLNTDLGTTSEKIDTISKSVETLPRFFNDALDRINLDKLDLFTQKVEGTMTVESGKASTQGIIEQEPIIPMIDPDKFSEDAKKIQETNNILLDSFSSLASGIVSSLDISNNSLRGFISLVLSAAPKIISAIIAQAAAKKAADAQIISSNAQVAGSEAVAVGAKAANALGPVGLALLPVFIGGALAIVGGAFSKLGKGGAISGGGGSAPSSGAPPQIFTNVNTVNPPSSTSPNYSGGSIDFNNAQSRMTVDIDGDKLKFIVDRANERRQAGG